MRYNKKRFIYLISPPKIKRNFFKDLNEVLKQKKVSFFQLRLKKDSFKNRIIKECFDMHLRDNYSLWQLDKNGNYKKRNIGKGRKKVSAQSILCNEHGDYL